MITILSGIFIKEKSEAQVRKIYGTLCGVTGIFLNICLFAGKYFAGLISGSVAILADAFNNLSDAGSSFITLIGFWFAGKKPDLDHPFGHGRFEYISGLVVAMAIILMGFELAQTSLGKIFHPESVETGWLVTGILVASILVKSYMFFYNYRIGKKIASAAMKATASDSLSDAAATGVVLLSMLVMRFTDVNIDGWAGLLVAGFILYTGYGAARETIGPLLGKQPDEEFVKEIRRIVMAHEEITGLHDLIVHDYGPGRVMLSLHAEVPGDGDIFALHDTIDIVERELKEKLGCSAVIHMDPMEMNNEAVEKVKQQVAGAVKEIHAQASIHDFRMIQGPTHTNLVFDVLVPYSSKMDDEEIQKRVEELTQTIDKTYFAVVNVDRSYV